VIVHPYAQFVQNWKRKDAFSRIRFGTLLCCSFPFAGITRIRSYGYDLSPKYLGTPYDLGTKVVGKTIFAIHWLRKSCILLD